MNKCDYNRGLDSCREIHPLLEECQTTYIDENRKRIADANVNMAILLMGITNPSEAPKILHSTCTPGETVPNEEINLSYVCICLFLLEQYEESLNVCNRLMKQTEARRGTKSAQTAL